MQVATYVYLIYYRQIKLFQHIIFAMLVIAIVILVIRYGMNYIRDNVIDCLVIGDGDYAKLLHTELLKNNFSTKLLVTRRKVEPTFTFNQGRTYHYTSIKDKVVYSPASQEELNSLSQAYAIPLDVITSTQDKLITSSQGFFRHDILDTFGNYIGAEVKPMYMYEFPKFDLQPIYCDISSVTNSNSFYKVVTDINVLYASQVFVVEPTSISCLEQYYDLDQPITAKIGLQYTNPNLDLDPSIPYGCNIQDKNLNMQYLCCNDIITTRIQEVVACTFDSGQGIYHIEADIDRIRDNIKLKELPTTDVKVFSLAFRQKTQNLILLNTFNHDSTSSERDLYLIIMSIVKLLVNK